MVRKDVTFKISVSSDGAKDQNPNHCSLCHTLPFPSQSLAEMTVNNAHFELHNVKGVNKRRKNLSSELLHNSCGGANMNL